MSRTRSPPELWSVGRHCHRARLRYPGGPDYHQLVVKYRVDGAAITVEVPITESGSSDLQGCLIILEILDDYSSATAERVVLTGRAEFTTQRAERTAARGPSWAAAGRTCQPVVMPIRVDGDVT